MSTTLFAIETPIVEMQGTDVFPIVRERGCDSGQQVFAPGFLEDAGDAGHRENGDQQHDQLHLRVEPEVHAADIGQLRRDSRPNPLAGFEFDFGGGLVEDQLEPHTGPLHHARP